MTELYKAADDLPANADPSMPRWITVQKLAFSNTLEDQQELEKMIQMAAQATVRLPILRKATTTQQCPFGNVVEGQMVILDLVSSPNGRSIDTNN